MVKKIKKDISDYLFEFGVYFVIIIVLVTGIFKYIIFSDDDDSNIIIHYEKRSILPCEDNSPNNSIVNIKNFTQIYVNGTWIPEHYDCFWECKEGFIKKENMCLEVVEK